jgi:hypothetical protein
MAARSDSRTGLAAILAGALIFAGQAGDLAFGSEPAVLNAWPLFWALGVAALVVAI